MDLLTIQHQDFSLTIECSRFQEIWDKAKRNIGAEGLLSNYYWSDGVIAVEYNQKRLSCGEKAPAIFFDNTEYPIWVEFCSEVEHASFCSARQKDNERFSFRKHILAGFINYGNDIGKSEIVLSYRIGGHSKIFTFGFDVLSTKLDYHSHWKKIIDDIEQEYRLLSLDYLRRTFHSFTPDYQGDSPDLIWWNLFEKEQQKFIESCKRIISRPRRQLKGVTSFLRADQLKSLPTNLEKEYAEYNLEPSHKYRIEERIQSNDTPENQFVKFAVNQIAKRYCLLKKHIIIEQLSQDRKIVLSQMEESLRLLQRHPFFRTVGPFKGINQENLVLQRATGYSQVYRTWNLLRRAYSLNDGVYRLQTKDIATLYEIWCLIEVSHIVKEKLGITDQDIHNINRPELNGVFTWELGKGDKSRILFYKDGVELVELVYNPKHSDVANDSISIQDLVVPTVPQKPDIVLQLTKNDISENKKITYLFDAKYRIQERKNGIDTPPDDAINQMHRYRDAIYYRQKDFNHSLKKEVIGGFILFPGAHDKYRDFKNADFYKSIDEVNIGAFPLRPNDNSSKTLLEDFIEGLIEAKGTTLLDRAIPQKGLFYTSKQEGDSVIVACIKNDKQLDWIKANKEFCLCIDDGVPGAVKPSGPFSHAQFLILYKYGETVSKTIYRLTGDYSIKAAKDLQTYPNLAGNEFLALRLDINVDSVLAEKEWDLSSEVFTAANGSPVIVKYSYLLPPEESVR